MIRIILADDHAIVRTGFRALIEEEPDLDIVAECANADEARAAVCKHVPDLLALDISMPGGGLALVPELKAAMPELRLLVLSMHDREPYISEAMHRGADGYVTKTAATDELVTAIRSVCAGKPYVSTDITRRNPVVACTSRSLSEREREVFLLLARGSTPKEASYALGISIKTVYLHRTAIREKLGVRSDLEMHRMAILQGLL